MKLDENLVCMYKSGFFMINITHREVVIAFKKLLKDLWIWEIFVNIFVFVCF